MHFTEFVEIDVRSLDNFDFSNLDVLDGVNRGNLLSDLLLDDLTGEEVKDLGSVGFSNFLGNDIVDSLSDDLLLRR
jgi:glycosylphosphatidylinositol transamidase (GPIT) subunit GPI8